MSEKWHYTGEGFKLVRFSFEYANLKNEYLLVDEWKYCPECDADTLGVAGRHDYCCWCGTKLEEKKSLLLL